MISGKVIAVPFTVLSKTWLRNYMRFRWFLFVIFYLCDIYSPFMWNIGFFRRTPCIPQGWKLIWATPTNRDSTFQGFFSKFPTSIPVIRLFISYNIAMSWLRPLGMVFYLIFFIAWQWKPVEKKLKKSWKSGWKKVRLKKLINQTERNYFCL